MHLADVEEERLAELERSCAETLCIERPYLLLDVEALMVERQERCLAAREERATGPGPPSVYAWPEHALGPPSRAALESECCGPRPPCAGRPSRTRCVCTGPTQESPPLIRTCLSSEDELLGRKVLLADGCRRLPVIPDGAV